jgi:hypothetical protein
VRYLYTTDLSLSEEVEEACRVGDRGAPQGRQGPGTRGFLILKEGETPGGIPLRGAPPLPRESVTNENN